jgi:YhcH/YjgK/YiaL family protein
MILDRLDNASMYRSLGPRIAAALDYLRQTDFSQMADGRYELDGDRLVAMVQRYRTRPPAEAKWEAHRQYLDVQYLAAGAERIGYASLRPDLAVVQAYDEAKDVVFFDVAGSLFEVSAGSFAIFAPQDIHAPCLAAGAPPTPADVLKVVIKCRVS